MMPAQTESPTPEQIAHQKKLNELTSSLFTKSSRSEPEFSLIDIHHAFMKFYGSWVPYSDMISMPVPVILGLLERVQEDSMEMQKEHERLLRRGRYK